MKGLISNSGVATNDNSQATQVSETKLDPISSSDHAGTFMVIFVYILNSFSSRSVQRGG